MCKLLVTNIVVDYMFQFLLVFLSVVSLLGIDINMVVAPSVPYAAAHPKAGPPKVQLPRWPIWRRLVHMSFTGDYNACAKTGCRRPPLFAGWAYHRFSGVLPESGYP
jgi:hypothetical protein